MGRCAEPRNPLLGRRPGRVRVKHQGELTGMESLRHARHATALPDRWRVATEPDVARPTDLLGRPLRNHRDFGRETFRQWQ